jgi:hypothetical protein
MAQERVGRRLAAQECCIHVGVSLPQASKNEESHDRSPRIAGTASRRMLLRRMRGG